MDVFNHCFSHTSHARWFMSDVRTSDLLKEEEIGKAQIREKRSTCATAIHLKEAGDTATNESALPLDVVEAIAKRLNVVDYLHFRATNRLFRLGAPRVQWRSFSPNSMSRFDDLSLSPLFVCPEKDKVLTFVHPKHGLKYKYTIILPKVGDLKINYEIRYSKDGWLLLGGNTCFQFFFNPFTKQVLPLPYRPESIRCVGFSHPPTSSKCVVAELDNTGLYSNVMARITYEGQWWNFAFVDSSFPLDNVGPAFHKGAFYYLSKRGKLGVLEAGKKKVTSWKELEKPCAPCTGYLNSFLVECDGNLLSVFENPYEKWVRVFKLNESARTWVKIESLGNRMLFVGNTSFCVVANIPGMENKIYFPRFYGQSIVFYSLDTNNYHTFKRKVVNFNRVEERLNSNWIEPRWH